MTARQRQNELIELWQSFNYGKVRGAFDAAMRWLGICQRATGGPYVTALTGEELETVDAVLGRRLGEQRGRSAEAR